VARGQDAIAERGVEDHAVDDIHDGSSATDEARTPGEVATRFGVVEPHQRKRLRELLAQALAKSRAEPEEPRRGLGPAPLCATTGLGWVALHRLNEPQPSLAGLEGSAEILSRATPPARA
jgi:hypothetical protein